MSIIVSVLFTTFLLAFALVTSFFALAMIVSVNPVSIKERRSDWMYVGFCALMTVWAASAIVAVW